MAAIIFARNDVTTDILSEWGEAIKLYIVGLNGFGFLNYENEIRVVLGEDEYQGIDALYMNPKSTVRQREKLEKQSMQSKENTVTNFLITGRYRGRLDLIESNRYIL